MEAKKIGAKNPLSVKSTLCIRYCAFHRSCYIIKKATFYQEKYKVIRSRPSRAPGGGLAALPST